MSTAAGRTVWRAMWWASPSGHTKQPLAPPRSHRAHINHTSSSFWLPDDDGAAARRWCAR